MAKLPQPGKTAILDGWVIRNGGDGYGIRAHRIDASPMTQIVVIEWTHPNYGYWADAGAFVKLGHMADWEPLGAVCWFSFASKEEFLQEYPEFSTLFFDRWELGEPVKMPAGE